MDVSLQVIRADISRRTRHSIHYIASNLIVWTGLALLNIVPDNAADKSLLYLAGAVLLWVLPLIVGTLLRLALFPRNNPLFVLYFIVWGLQLLFLPVLAGAYFSGHQLVPWFLGVACGVQFLLLAWVHGSSAYLFCALGALEVSILTGWLAPGLTLLAEPLAILLVLIIGAFYLLRSNAESRIKSPY